MCILNIFGNNRVGYEIKFVLTHLSKIILEITLKVYTNNQSFLGGRLNRTGNIPTENISNTYKNFFSF
jgi:hypothetical protein